MRRNAIVLFIGLALGVACLAPAGASAASFTQCPPVDADAGCQFLITVSDGGVTVAEDATQGPYDAADDTMVGIQNNSSKSISSIPIASEESIFGFDVDGLCEPEAFPRPAGCVVLSKNSEGTALTNHGEACPVSEVAKENNGSCAFLPPAGEPAGFDPYSSAFISFVGFGPSGQAVSGYEGPTSWFSSIGGTSANSGVVNFSPALAPGQATYFSLEEALTGKTLTIGNATTLATTLTGGGQIGASVSVVQGTPVTDTATLGGSGASVGTGTVTYSVYGDAACTQLAAAAGTASVSGGVAGASSALSGLAPGKYYWQAKYGGDINNQAASSVCGSEVLTVLAPTTTTTTQTGGGVTGAKVTVPVGTPVTDSAHIAGSLAAVSTGTVSYVLYKDNKCTVPAAATSAAAVSKGVAGLSAAVKPVAGTYYWKASYGGDALNAGSLSACGSEVLTVAKPTNFGLAALSKKCVSKRRFIAHPRAPKGVKLLSVQVFINGKLKATGKIRKGATTINLRGLPKGTFKVAMIATSSKGQTYEDVRTFHTCVPKRHHK